MKKYKALLVAALLAVCAIVPATHSVAADANLIANPSLETVSGVNPADWQTNYWGSLKATFKYETAGRTGNRSVTTTVANYKSGDAKWKPTVVNVTPGVTYTFSDWYKSTAVTSIDVVVGTTSGTTNYVWKGDFAASAAWKQTTFTYKAPANAKTLTFHHYLRTNGTLTVDDYSLTAPGTTAPTAPTVSLTAPANNATVSDTQAVSANAGDVQGVTSVQFKLDGNNLGAADTTAPYTVNWDTKTATNGNHVLTAVATNQSNLTTTSTAVNVNVNNTVTPVPTAPVVAFSAPAADATVAGATNVSTTFSDSKGVKSLEWKLDGIAAGSIANPAASPYTFAWDTTKVTNGVHTWTVTATNQDNLTATATRSFTVNNPTAPVVNVTAPAANATVSGTQAVSATATSNVAITSVQFKLDGANLGAADTTAPYSIDWDTKTVANGNHVLTAVATNAAGQTTTAANVTVNVSNTVVTPPVTPANLIANPSVETAGPAGWGDGSWGNNTHTNTYENTGRTGAKSLKTTITAYTDGDAKWYFTPVNVTAGQTYAYSNWYKSSVDTELDAAVTFADGTVQYYYLTTAPASPNDWSQVKVQFVAPANAKNVTIFQALAKVGYVQSDDFSFAQFNPAKFNRAMVSLTFDDGWRSIYANGLPVLTKYGLPSTQYLLTDTVTYPDYMTIAMMQEFKDKGHEIASHTNSHADLATLSAAALMEELQGSRDQLQAWYGPTVAKNFATPYGSYNTTVVNEIKKYYRSHRSTDVGYNSKDSFNLYNIRVQNILDGTTNAQVAAWIAQAQADKTWLVLVYHAVGPDPSPAQEDYSVTVAKLDAQLAQIKNSGISVQTVEQALNEILPQL
jgi:peptidoglycan/xylan/chitin deacetylase (PgdA/CDA1 family)